MTLPDLTPLLDWLSANPHLAGTLVFAIAFGESLAMVGLVMPGALLMFGTGAVIGTGALPFWPMCAWAAAGAISGDAVSFWLGRRLHGRMEEIWPFRTRPQLLARATDFFRRHGGKGVLLGRFVGPIRPVIPAVAGMLQMPVARFLAVNVLSGLLWAPAYLLPGVVFGASLGIAAEVAARLVLMLLVLAAGALVTWYLVRALWRAVHPHVHVAIQRLLAWARLHPVAGEIPAALLDPSHPETRGLTLLALMMIGAAAIFLLLLEQAGGGIVAGLDALTYHALQDLRTPWMDRAMVVITTFGDAAVLLAGFGVVLVLLLWKRRWHAAVHWFAAGAVAAVSVPAIKLATAVARPVDLYGGTSEFAFPSGHTVGAAMVYGLLAVLVARELAPTRRWIAYAIGTTLITLIALSRLYLGVHWLSDVLGGLALGLAWVSLLGIAYRRHTAGSIHWPGLALAAGVAVAGAVTLRLVPNFEQRVATYRFDPTPVALSAAAWWNDDWRTLPATRIDLRGQAGQPLNVQFAGDTALLSQTLGQQGWASPPALDGYTWLRWFGADVAALPLLPQVHDGRHEVLVLTKPTSEGNAVWTLRLWESGWRLEPGRVPVWIGCASLVAPVSPVGGLSLPRTQGAFDAAREVLAADLTVMPLTAARRDGVLLVRSLQ